MADKRNILEKILGNEGEKQKLIGDEVVSMRSYPSLVKLNAYNGDSRGIRFFQAVILLTFFLFLPFLFFLYLKRYPLIYDGVLDGNIIPIVSYSFGAALLLLSVSVFHPTLTKIWFSILSGLICYFSINAFFYHSFTISSFPAFINNHMTILASLLVVLIMLMTSWLFFRLFFYLGVLVLPVLTGYMLFHLSTVKYPEEHVFNPPMTITDGSTQNTLHIMMGDHISLDYLQEIEPRPVMTGVISSFYNYYNFSLYTKPYAYDNFPYQEITSIFNRRAEQNAIFHKKDSYLVNRNNGIDSYLVQNEYFPFLRYRGYNIHVYQPGPLNYCTFASKSIHRCVSYAPFYSLRNDKASILSSFFNNDVSDKYDIIFALERIFKDVHKDIASSSGKNMFFIDMSALLSPPYRHDENCNTADKEIKGLNGYRRVLSCGYKKLYSLMNSLNNSGALRNTTVIVHGTGGSKLIPINRDLIHSNDKGLELAKDSYNSIFAVRKSTSPKASVQTNCDLTTLLWNETLDTQGSCRPFVLNRFTIESLQNFNAAYSSWLVSPFSIDSDTAFNYFRQWLSRN